MWFMGLCFFIVVGLFGLFLVRHRNLLLLSDEDEALDAVCPDNPDSKDKEGDDPVLPLTPNQQFVYAYSKRLAKLRLVCRQMDDAFAAENLELPRQITIHEMKPYESWAEACAAQKLDTCMILVKTCSPYQARMDELTGIQAQILNDSSLVPDSDVLASSGMTAKEFSAAEWEVAWMVRPRFTFGQIILCHTPSGMISVSLSDLDMAVKSVLIRRFSNTVRTMSQFHAQALQELDKSISEFVYVHDVKKSSKAFREWTIDGFMRMYLKTDYGRMRDWLDRADKNHRIVEELNAVYESGISSGDDRSYQMIASRIDISEQEYYEIVNRICRGMRIQEPRPGAWAITYSYTSPQGRTHKEKLYRLYAEELRRHLDTYQNRDEQLSFAEKQRRLMTPKLRYQVLREDGFRCVLCGRGQEDGIKLEVDHILPVSRGGRTIRSNLRTLCWDCNQGKHDEYHADGVN